MLIEFSKRNLLDRMFELSFQFAVLDLLFNEELIDLGHYDRQDLIRLGLCVEALDPEGVATAIAYQSRRRALSLVDCFALALAHNLLAGPRASVWESRWQPPRLSDDASSPWPDASPAKPVVSPCIFPNTGPGKTGSALPWRDCAPCPSLPDAVLGV